MRKIIFIFTLFITLNCNAQDSIQKTYIMKEIMKTPKINKEYEVFDREKYFPKKKGTIDTNTFKPCVRYTEYDEHRKIRKDFVGGVDENDHITGYDYSANPLIGIYSEFYEKNGGIKTKGIYCCFGFKMGQWYHYDLNGNLIQTENHDEGFEFTAEEIFAYCLDHNISLEKKEGGLRTEIRKYTSAEKESSWYISYPDYRKRKEISIRLDGKTGEVITINEYDFPTW